MRWSAYFKEHALYFFSQGFYLCFSATLLHLLNVSAFALVFLGFLYLILNFGFHLFDYWKRYNYLNQATQLAQHCDETHYLCELLEEPKLDCEKQWYFLFKLVGKSMNDKIGQYRKSNEDYREYIEAWVHEVKTPIATGKLIVENHRNEHTESLEEELDKVDQYVEQALYYARSSTVEKDYVIKRCNLRNLINEAVKKQAKQCIAHHVSVSLLQLDETVFADSKWIDFVLGQIINNAIKYRGAEKPMITFDAKKNSQSVILEITDNGIGVSEKECSRLFDKGFTGENGRKYTKSTGIGLYLVKRLCDKMNIATSVQSTLNMGTTVTLIFPLTDFYHKN